MPLRLRILENEEGNGELAEMDARTFIASLDETQRSLFEERAAIMEYDGGLTRAEAEKKAWACCSPGNGLKIGWGVPG